MVLDADIPSEPTRYMTSVMDLLNQLSGVMVDTTEGDVPGYIRLTYHIPLEQTFGLHKKMMACCEGRISLNIGFREYGPVPSLKVERLQKQKNLTK